MTLLFEHTAEGGTDEADVGTGSGFGTPWTSVSKTGACTIKYDTAQAMHGTVSIRFVRPASSDSGYCLGQLGSAVTRMQTRSYWYMTSLPTSGLDLGVHRHASGFMGYVSIGVGSGGAADGKLILRNTSGTGIANSRASATFPLSQWVRVETTITAGAGTGAFEYAYYLGDSTTPVSIWSSASTSATVGAWATSDTSTGNPIGLRFGHNGATNVPGTIWLDDPALGDGASGWLGPSSVDPPVAIVDGEVVHLIDATASTLTAGTKSYGIAQTSGTTTTPTLVTTGIWSVVPHATSTLIYDVTVTGSLGGNDVEPYTVPPLSSGTASVTRLIKAAGVFS